MELDKLEGLGIPAGNALRLRDASLPWVTGPLAKRARSDSSPERASSSPGRASKRQHLVEYEKRWYDDAGNEAGSSRFTGPTMAPSHDEQHSETGFQVYFKCIARNDWVQVPRGYVVDTEGDYNPFE